MGTRSLTVFIDEGGNEICVLYRQFDGYFDGHGLDLANFLKGKEIVNGLAGDKSMVFNGMGCLAASVVSHFKKEAGSFYLYPAGTRNVWEEYVYEVTGVEGQEPRIKVGEIDCFASEFEGHMQRALEQQDE